MAILQNISDFAFCKKFLENVCLQYGCEFKDLDVEYDESYHNPKFENGVIRLPLEIKINKAMFAIISLYLANTKTISKLDIPNNERSILNKLVFGIVSSFVNGNTNYKSEDFFKTRLDQYHEVYILLDGLVCPFIQCHLNNISVIVGRSGHLDVAKLVKKEDITASIKEEDTPFIFMNIDVRNASIRNAFLFYEAVSAHCDNPSVIINAIFADKILGKKFIGYISMIYSNSEEIANFFLILSILCNSREMEEYSNHVNTNNVDIKTAQLGSTNWWFLGLIEKQLDPSRGPDWTVHKMWQPFLDDLNKRVEKERRRMHLDELPLELLLRVQGDEFSIDENQSLQTLLSNDRVW